jgi:hypothetical protein
MSQEKEVTTIVYVVRGKARRKGSQSEDIGQFNTPEEARKMLQEYRIAYGNSWSLWLRARRDGAPLQLSEELSLLEFAGII